MTKMVSLSRGDLPVADPQSLAAAELDMQVATARRWPRDFQAALARAEKMATSTPDIAASCSYALPRGGKTIDGPSVRLAEILAQNWGNCRVAASIVDIGERTVTARGMWHDLESNAAVAVEVSRPILKSSGQRFDDDMINVTCQAALSIARRNAIFAGLGEGLYWPIYEAARRAASGDAKLAERRQKMLAAFARVGVHEAQLLAFLGVASIAEITAQNVSDLLGVWQSIKDGELEPEGVFGPVPGAKPAEAKAAPAAAPRAPKAPVAAKSDFESALEAAGTLAEIDAVAAAFFDPALDDDDQARRRALIADRREEVGA